MNWIFWAAIAVAIFIAILVAYTSDYPVESGIGTLCASGFLISLLWLVSDMTASVSGHTGKHEPVVTETYEIVQCRESTALSGKLTVWTTNEQFEFYRKNSDGSYALDHIDAAGSRIIESDSEPPHVIKYIKVRDVNNFGWYPRNFFTQEKLKKITTHYSRSGVIVVPVGTIIPDKYDNLNL